MKVKNIRHLMLGIICLVLAAGMLLAMLSGCGSRWGRQADLRPNISSAPSCCWLWAL